MKKRPDPGRPNDHQTSVAGEEDPGAAVDHVHRPPSPRNLVSRSPRAPGSMPPAPADEHLQLPHERDEDADMTASEPDPVIAQAAKDLARGLVDTDMRATPGLDADKRQSDVPGPGGKPRKG